MMRCCPHNGWADKIDRTPYSHGGWANSHFVFINNKTTEAGDVGGLAKVFRSVTAHR